MNETALGGGATAGSLLRQAREASGTHIEALAMVLKVPVSKLEALEADNHAVLIDIVFVRAIAASVCRILKTDPAPVLALLPHSQPCLPTNAARLDARIKSRAASASSFPGSASRPAMLVVLALLLGALLLFFYPRQWQDAADSQADAPVAADPTAPVPAAAPVPLAMALSEPPAESAVLAASAATGAASAAAAVVAAEGAQVDRGGRVDPAAQLLVLRARSQSWVQVRDATGALAVQRTLAASESVTVAAPAPLSVVIGRADATEVLVRGKPFDLQAVVRDNVARFEVK